MTGCILIWTAPVLHFLFTSKPTTMNSESIMVSDVLDIVFENRNKLYGAYTLRKFYNNRLIKSLGITLGIVTILSAFTLLPAKEIPIVAEMPYIICTISKIKPPDAKKQLPKQVIKSRGAAQKKFITPVIVDDKMKVDTLQLIKQTDLTGFANSNIPGSNVAALIGAVGIETPDNGVGIKPVEEIVAVTQPIENPDIEPAYPGGINALRKFLERNLVNPIAMEKDEMVAVNVKFVVGYDGKLQQFIVVKDGGEIFNKEVIRVLKKMPQWIPGKSKGQNVAVYFTIPIKFIPAD